MEPINLPELPEEIEVAVETVKRSFIGKALRWFFRLLWHIANALVLSLIILYLLFQIPAVQRWSVKTITGYASEKLHTTVKAEAMYVDFYDVFVLKNFFVADLKGDTLLYSKLLNVDFSLNPLKLIKGKIIIDKVTLEEAQMSILRKKGEAKSNLQVILDIINPPTNVPSPPSKTPDLVIGAVGLKNIKINQEDRVNGNGLKVAVKQGDIYVNKMDLPNQLIDIASIDIQKLYLETNRYERHLLANPIPEKQIIVQNIGKDTTQHKPLNISINSIKVKESHYVNHNYQNEPTRLKPDNEMDYQHMDVRDIDLDIENFSLKEGVFKGKVKNAAAREMSGFILSRLSVANATVSSRGFELDGLHLITPYSTLGDTLIFKYNQWSDFLHFNDEVYMDGRFNHSNVALKDIMAFVPALNKNAFFNKNRDEIVNIDGKMNGKVNSLKGKNLNIKIAKNTAIKGNFTSRDLAVKGSAFLNFNLESLHTTAQTLSLLIPNFKPAENFNKLGTLDFSGNFTGYFEAFTAYGLLHTDLGSIQSDMSLNVREGKPNATFSGKLNLFDFDLGKWINNPQFGKVSFKSIVNNGRGLTIERINADLTANVEKFYFKNYTYKNFEVKGKINQNLFDGNFSIKDNNVDLLFNGTIDYASALPVFDFKAHINTLNLLALNLSDRDLQLSGDVNLNIIGKNISDLRGKALIQKLKIIENQKNTYLIDSIIVSSQRKDDSSKIFKIESEIVNANIEGFFNLGQIPDVFKRFMERNHPIYAQRWNLVRKDSTKILEPHHFIFNVNIKNTGNFTKLLNEGLDTIKNVELTGSFYDQTDSLTLLLNVPKVKINNVNISDIYLKSENWGNQGTIDCNIYNTKIGDSTNILPIYLLGAIDADTLHFGITGVDFKNVLDKLELNGDLFPIDSNYQVRFLTSNLVIFNRNWTIKEDNFIRFGKDFIQTNNFELNSDNRKITLESIGRYGLALQCQNFDLAFINEAIKYDKLRFQGNYEINAEIGNVFQMTNMHLVAQSDSLWINHDDRGALRIDANMEDLKSPAEINLSITKDNEQILAEGNYYPPGLSDKWKQRKTSNLANTIDFKVHTTNYPLSVLEYFIDSGISGTTGNINADVHFYGPFKKVEMDGKATVTDVAVTINYLKTRYFAPKGNVKLSSYKIDLTGEILKDELGNTANLYGGLLHDHFKDWKLDFRLKSDHFLCINTKKEDNKLFYGYGIGAGDVSFTGSFKYTDIKVNAVTHRGTRIVVPINNNKTAKAVSFIKFKSPEDFATNKTDNNNNNSTLPKGIDLDMEITMTDTAECWLVFDEFVGDIIKGRGNGNIQISVSRSGDFRMYGDYDIEQGEYLFTFYYLFNKPFIVKRGGTIHWTGDPFGAEINLSAEYKGLSTAPYNFIEEYLVDDEIKTLARKSTPIDLNMNLKGALFKPDIAFNIAFPNISSELKSYTEDKLRIVRQDQNELNRQVFGLVVVGSFLPAEASRQGSNTITTGINTLSEILTSQLSNYLTGLLSEYVKDVEFNIAYNRYQLDNLDGNELIRTGNDFQARIKKDFLDGRIQITGGIGVESGTVAESSGSSNTFIAGDIIVEYFLTPDRRLKIKVYNSTDQVLVGRRNKSGVGVTYRREFDSFSELLKGMESSIKELREGAIF